MTKSSLFTLAHKNTREVKKVYPEISYSAQFKLELSYLYKQENMNIKEKLEQTFNETARRWAQADTEIEIKNWRNRRVYINIKHHTYHIDAYLNIENKDRITLVRTAARHKNSTLKTAYENTMNFVKNNAKQIIKEAK